MSREIKGWKELGEYLISLERDQSKKPFDCPKLVVLPEKVRYKPEEFSKPEVYRKGSLLCHVRTFTSKGSRPRCAINSEIDMTEDGKLEVLCDGGFGCGYFTIEIKNFRKPNP